MLLGLIGFWYIKIVPKKNAPVLSDKIKKVMSGQLSSNEIYKDSNLLKEMVDCLDSTAVMGTRTKVVIRRNYPKKLKKKGRHRYFTRSDWALEVLSYISFSDLQVRPKAEWQIKVSRLQYGSGLSPKLMHEDLGLEKNKELIEKWQSLWKEYFDYVLSKRKTT